MGKTQDMKCRCPQCGAERGAQLSKECILLSHNMPSLWLTKLVTEHLDGKDRRALFQTCKGLAVAMGQHCKRLQFTPSRERRGNDCAFAFAVSLAAACSNVHLYLCDDSILLDKLAIREHITHITLKCMPLNSRHMSRLYIRQLTHLHTISFIEAVRPYTPVKLVDEDAMQSLSSIIQAGGLSSLRTLEGKYSSLCTLAPVIRKHITKLVVTAGNSLDGLESCWPALQQIEIRNLGSTLPNDPENVTSLSELLKHPTLTHVTAPARLVTYDSQELEDLSSAHLWEVLDLTGSSVDLRQLGQLPLHAVKVLQFPAKLTCGDEMTAEIVSAAVQNLQRCSSVKLVPEWSYLLPAAMVAIQLCFEPELLTVLFEKDPEMQGVLLLERLAVDHWDAAFPSPDHAAVSQNIPKGIHCLVCYRWSSADDCSWEDLFASIPDHITCMYLCSCDISEEEWLDLLSGPAPIGLRRLIVKDRSKKSPWIPWEGEDLEDMQRQVKLNWPHVQLLLA